MKATPQQVSTLKHRAREAADGLKFHEASELLESTVKKEPSCRHTWIALGHCYLMTHKYQAALQAYQHAEGLAPGETDCEALYGTGLAHYKCGQNSEAERAFQAVLKAQPEFVHRGQVLFKLGLLNQKQRNYSKAVFFLRTVLSYTDLDSGIKAEALCQIGLCYCKLRRVPDAVYTFREAVQLRPNSFEASICLGWSLFIHNEQSEALKCLQRSITFARTQTETLQATYWLARCYLDLRRFCNSQAAFQQVIRLQPDLPSVWNSVGVLYAHAEQLQNAFECFAKAVSLSSAGSGHNLGVYWANLAVLFTQSGSSAEAELALAYACSVDSAYDQLSTSLSNSEVLSKLDHATSDDPYMILSKQTEFVPEPQESRPSLDIEHSSGDITPQRKSAKPRQNNTPQDLALPHALELPKLKHVSERRPEMQKIPKLSSILNQIEAKKALPSTQLPQSPPQPVPLYSPRPPAQIWSMPAAHATSQPAACPPVHFSDYLGLYNHQPAQNLSFGHCPPRCTQHYPYTVGVYQPAQPYQPPIQTISSSINRWLPQLTPISGLMSSLNALPHVNSFVTPPTQDSCHKRPSADLANHPRKKKKD